MMNQAGAVRGAECFQIDIGCGECENGEVNPNSCG